MINALHHKQTTLAYRTLCGFIALTFLTSVVLPPSYAQSVLNLPVPGTMVPPSSGFAPALMTGITIHPDNPLRFDFIMDRGQSGLADEPLKKEYEKMIKYFMASLTVPEDELWVNLSPYEKDRMVPQGFGDTEMGRDMLAQDYLLKQLTASLMYPERELGQKFWDRIYKKAKEQFGTTEIPVNTFNKVWIVPDEAVVYEQGTSAFVIKSRLAVMLEEDYVAMNSNVGASSLVDTGDQAGTSPAPAEDNISTSIIREIILPEIEHEVNYGKNFANLRQIYNALILATWYKQRLKDSLLGKVYVDQNKTKGIDTEDEEINQKIYGQYIESFKKGVYNFIKEDVDPATHEMTPRKYFSGGARLTSSPVKGDLKLRSLQTLALGTVLAFGVSSFSARDVSAAVTGTRDGVTTEFVDNGEESNIGTAITVRPGVQPILLAQTSQPPGGGTSSSPVEIERAFRENAQELKDADFNDLLKDYPVTGIKRIVDKAREVFSLGLPLADYTKLISELNYRKARTFRFETLGLFLSDDLGTQPRWMIDVLQQKTIPYLLNLSNAIDIFIEKADLIKNKAVKTRVMNRLRAYRELVNDFLESAYQFLDDLVAKHDVDRIAIPWIYYGPHKKLWVDTGETSLVSYVEIRIHAQAHSNGQIVIDIYNDWVSDAGRKVFRSSDPRFQSKTFYTAVKNILNSGGVFSGWEDLSKAVARDSSLIKTDSASSPVEMEPVIEAFETADYDAALQHLDQLIADTKQPGILAKLNEAKEKIGQIKTLAKRVASQKESIPEAVSEKIKFEEARLERLQEMAADSAGREVTLSRLRISIDKVESSIRDIARQTPKAEVYLKSRELLAKNRSRILSRLRELEAFLETVVVEAPSEEVIADFPAPVEKSSVQADVPTEDAVEIDTLSAAKENFWKSRNLAEAGAALKNLRTVYTKARKMSLEDLLKDTEIKSPTTLYESFDKGKTLVYQLAQPQGDIVYQRGDVNPMLVRYAQRLTLIDGEHAEEDFVRFLRDLSGIEPTISLQAPLSTDDLWEIPADVTTWEDLIYFWEYARSRLLDLGKMNILGHRFNGGNGQQRLANFKKNPAKYLSDITEQEAKKWGELVKINGDEMWEAIERIKKTEEVKKREAKYRSQEVPEEDDTPLAMPPQQGSSKEALWDEVLQKVQESEKGRPVLQPRKEEDIPLLPYIPKEVKNFESFGRFIKERMAELGKSPALVAAQIGVTAPTVTVFYYQGKYLYSKREGNARRILGKMKRLAYALKIEEAVFLERIAELQAQGEKPAPAASAKTPITILQPSVLAQFAPEVVVTPQADVALPPQIVVPPVSDEIIQDLFDLTKEEFEAEKESEVGEILRGLLEDYPGVSQEQIDPALDRVVAMLREDAQKPRVIAPVSDEIMQNLFDLSKEEFDSEKESEVREILRELLKDYPGVSQEQIDPALDRVVTMLRDSRKVFVPAGATAMSLAADIPVPVTSQTEKNARRPSSAQGDTLAKKIAQLNEKDAAIVRKFIEDMEKLGFKGDAIFKVKFDEINRQYNRMSKESHRTLFKVYGEVMSLLKHPVIIEFKNGAKGSSPVVEPPGGIDLNPALLDLQIRRDDNGVPLPLPLQPVETMHIDGFLPVIINITPISNLPLLLGLVDTTTDTQEARPASKAREIEPISLLN